MRQPATRWARILASLIQTCPLLRIIQEGLGDPVLVYPIAARVAEGVLGLSWIAKCSER